MAEQRLKKRVVLANALPALVVSAMGLVFYTYLPKFYADVVGVPVQLLGLLIIATRLWDAVTDPVIGALSDRTRSRWGRRLPWVAGATVPLAVSMWALMNPPATGAGAALWFFLATLCFFLFWTMIVIPYESLGAELTLDYDERHRLYGAREGALVLGTLVAGALPVIIAQAGNLGPGAEDQRELFRRLAVALSVMLVIGVGVFLLIVRERGFAPTSTTLWQSILGGWRVAIAPGPYRLLLIAYTIGAFGSMLPSTMMFFFVEHVLQSARKELFLLLYLGVGILLLPMWVVLARRWEKRTAWLAAMGINTGAFAFTLLLGAGDELGFAIVCIVSGIGLGGTLAIPASMQADVIDHDEWGHGVRREGELIGVWSIARKLAQAIGAGIGLPILGLAGYIQSPGAAQPASAVLALSLLYAGVPCLCNIASMAVAWRYPIDRAMHHRLRAEIAARQSAPGVTG